MRSVRSSQPALEGIEPYDPKYLPADALMSANENPENVPALVLDEIERAVRSLAFNRYPDPLANELRDLIAQENGLARENVLIGNGGDELLFDIALAWGGPGRTFLNVPPTFSVYEANARLTGTTTVNIARRGLHDRRRGRPYACWHWRRRLPHHHEPQQPHGRFGREGVSPSTARSDRCPRRRR